MKAKLDFRSKRTIIVTAIIAALAVGAGVGGYFYAKGNNEASAATNISDASQTATEQAPSGDNNQGTTDSNANNGNGNGGTTTPTDGATGDNAGNDGAANDGANANGNAGNAGNGGAANAGNAGNAGAAGNAGGAGAGNAGNGAAGNAGAGAGDNDGDATTTTWESHETSWRPQTLNVSTPEVNVNKNKISVAKTATTSTGYNTVSAGDSITYTITVTNNNTETLNSLYIADEIPEGTTFDSIENGGETVKENDVVTRVYWNLWNLGIEAGKTYSVSFKVTVNKDAKGTIKNVATVEGEPSNKNEDGDPEPTKNPVIKSNKNASLVETDKDDDGNDVEKLTDLKDEKVKEGQIIRYTISVENTSKEEKATTKVSDTVPEGTTLQGEEGKEVTVVNGEETTTYTIANLNEGIELTLDKESKATVSFDVKVNKDTPKFIKNIATVGGETPTTENEVYMDIEVSKKWEDADDQDGKRPDEITLVLYKTVGEKTEEAEKVTVTARNKWKYTFKDLAKFDGENEITYSVEEELTDVVTGTDAAGTYKVDKVGDYKTGITITNTHTPELVNNENGEIAVEKEWDDNENQDGMRKEVTIQLYKVTTNEAGEETLTEVEGKKVTIKADATGEGLKAKFDKLPKYENGKEIKYTVRETTKVANYEEPVVTGDQAKGFKVTNKHTPELVNNENGEIAVEKEWDDNENQDGMRKEVTIQLYKVTTNEAGEETLTEVEGKKVTIKADATGEGLKAKFDKLPKYENGKEIKYTVRETTKVANYEEPVVTGDQAKGFKVTNKHTPELVNNENGEIAVEKEWDDNENQDGMRKEVTIQLYKVTTNEAGEETLTEVEGKKVTIKADATGEGLKAKFDKLPKYENGKEIKYTVRETTKVANYEEPVVTGDQAKGFKVTNTHTPETTEVSGEKTWVDGKYKDKTRPESITINLLADGEPALDDNGKAITANVTEGKDKTWKYSFTGLDKYKNGKVIKYTITENKLENYTTEINKYDVKNTLKTTEVSVHKTWIDAENNKKHPTIKINLYQNVDEITEETKPYDSVSLENGTIDYTFRDLPKVDAQGKEYSYKVAEEDVIGYKSTMSGDATSGYTIKNTQETTTATVIKVWDDEDDLDGVRPNNITVQLKADGSNYGSETVLSKDTEGIDVKIINNKETWIYTFTNLPKVNDKNKNYEYTAVETKIGEDRVSNNKTDDYTVSTANADEGLNTTTIANTHIVERISVDVSKEWVDGNRSHTSDTITVKLLADGKDTKKTVKLSDSNKWKDSFTGLRKYINGKEVEYTVEEANVPSGYTSKITGSQSKGYKITNTLNKPRSVTLTKHYTETSQTEVKVPIDVVFILDTSTSMRTIQDKQHHSRAYNMVEAVNATINELKESNSKNRISIVGYSDTASVIMPLKEASKVSKNPLSYSNYNISCSGGTPRSVDGGTYTQSGIALGTQQLIDVRDKTVEIQDQILTRVPVIILLSDGMPTYYTTDYDDVNATSTSGRLGDGYNETVEQGYYTIMSADYYKGEVTKEYKITDKKITAKMYTVAVNVNSQYGLTVLNPITDNINNLKDSTESIADEYYPNGKYYADANFYKLLNGEKYKGLKKYTYDDDYYEIERDPKDLEDFNASRKNEDGYSYADGAYTDNVDKEKLLANMEAAIDEATPKYITTQATQAEIDSYMVEIKDLDYSKDMTIKANGETYNKSKVVTEIDGKYYLDLTKFPNNCDITVDYQSI